ncbi:tRNA (adenosine(37)-N6)-threonylcarbamoyltransferase complex ATPase subunit type 1 TsaE [Marinobacter halophilus]|uniref:tRNA threonylcarbamoyladenosine biosynthesis protein TsaE n=1 Tax=Marinobacter halophilus TaxID=1323740 RepID=A0A2T1KCQ4_9GAMM|nr:tRNA (adenosine(37)-N6)-threonylcarbamoyltransferase complex ATPase subunit type 1 TsaE [Marinobacter halophilus]PSF07901.1 tRNA (adenosine(37)-N6)-threonylcarbamoyltransferase complex ATPase subunit type 1 TsaE [Marinobacter halophilus]GGC58085.1 tRNA (adenosine(37)-N6)-threonylcarbamoyltransferase complex ATPase subunit type 1 TsaE [Marinobacter halophilus]
MNIFGNERRFFLESESETEQLGGELASLVKASGRGVTVFLDGELGMGKTTLSRGVMRGLGHEGAVKSPTYTLVEPYEELEPPVYHFDLYRLGDPEELEYMGIRDYFSERSFCLIEWPERGQGVLPDPDLEIHLERQDDGRSVVLRARSEFGASLLNNIELIGPDL